jgi:hypothetical protein
MRAIWPIATALVLLTGGGARATSWDAALDFSNRNPSGAWSYWWGNTGTSMARHNSWGYAPAYYKGIDVWYTDSHGGRVDKSLSKTPFADSGQLYPPGPLIFDATGVANDDAIVCWTAPAASSYNFSGAFEILGGPQPNAQQVKTKVFKGITDITSTVFPNTSGLLTGPPYANLTTLTPGAKEPFNFVKYVDVGQLVCFGSGSIDGTTQPFPTGLEVIVTQQ